jgi:hypothetical protein
MQHAKGYPEKANNQIKRKLDTPMRMTPKKKRTSPY